MATKTWKSFLCLFAQDHPDFRVQELQSLVSIFGSEVRFDHTSYSNKNPYLIVQLESEDVARHVLSRSLLLKSIFELWGWGRDYSELKSSIQVNMSEEAMKPYTRTDYTFKLVGSGFSRKCSMERQKMMFEKLSFLPLNGKVDVHNYQHIFHILEDYGDSPNTAPLEPIRIFFGRLIGRGQRDLILRYSVKNRHFIGSTSMDAQLAFIMANQAKVRCGSLVLDPFAGTGVLYVDNSNNMTHLFVGGCGLIGSVLVACAHFGAHVVGADIGWKVVHGKGCTSRAGVARERGQDENVRANLRQYRLEGKYIDMLVADAANPPWKPQEVFDAVVTDPPYGIREGGRKVGSKSQEVKPIPLNRLGDHIPEVKAYRFSDLMMDLVSFAARFLVMGGRLVYWVPMVKSEFLVLPEHPCLHRVSCSLQPLQRHVGRQLVTMEKCRPWQEYQLNRDQAQEDQAKQKLECHDNFREKYFTTMDTSTHGV